ncbi:CGNR zinc finger domain-containing protein [Mucilaginibacter segetis]|uniref:CGNR zinc finger domain-containing protein n=1 Tax=Mucilaginibacter segetis TaxID=2793071 RepID=A0A934PUP8_9SPHI|nr:ABATE domain-containing protein [Mucilaginibacter segetis]MBK0380384.1 CGNR zinc finger domain-containing protein [Mucilaginibacter segetis]
MQTSIGGAMNRFYAHCQQKNFADAPFHGNAAVLNFINTAKNSRRHDYLPSYDAFLYWCREGGVIDGSTYLTLEFEAYCNPIEIQELHRQVIELRETLTELFTALLHKTELPVYAMPRINRWLATARQHLSYQVINGRPATQWINIHEELAFPLWVLVLEAQELFDPVWLAKLKQCRGCGALYLDVSKCRTRTWCSANACGKKLRNRRYYKKKVLGNNA